MGFVVDPCPDSGPERSSHVAVVTESVTSLFHLCLSLSSCSCSSPYVIDLVRNEPVGRFRHCQIVDLAGGFLMVYVSLSSVP